MSTPGIDSAERIVCRDPAAKENGFTTTCDSTQEVGEGGRGRWLEAEEKEKKRKKERDRVDPELFSCLLQPLAADGDPNYVGLRRLLLHRKASSGILRCREWRCNGKGYVAYRNYIGNWEMLQTSSHPSTPGNSGRWVSSPNPFSHLYEVESWSSCRDVRGGNLGSSHRTSFSSNASDTDRPNHCGTELAYSFVGMHCIFDQCRASVTVLKFGHASSTLLAFGAADGTLTVCSVSEPPSVIKQLSGHSNEVTGWLGCAKAVNFKLKDYLDYIECNGKFDVYAPFAFSDFEFSSNNYYIASTSMDKTVRVWEISKGTCIRVIYGVSCQLCIRFHPVNNNFLSVGNAYKEVTVLNFSTGRMINKTSLYSEVTAMDHDHTGQLIFCGDAQGSIHTISMNSHSGVLSRAHRDRSGSKHRSRVTTVQYRSFSLLARGPVLLTCTQDGTLSFFSVAMEVKGYLTLRCSLKLNPRLHSIKASFCPLLSLEKGEYIVSGSEDSNVYFYDLTRPKHTCVNKLQGHRFPVVCVAWNHGDNLLASSDLYGTVIVWKRAKTS